ncbi:DUF1435 domain-containing protein [Affinibrenneria salicis]|uniref:DUF1435 domain-containing protein n=1 Tax=Affinibrenneria salicis TaxID=2590031 RepID=A0A5J5G6X3_9GAMM|nr:DUF1435 family protein [Affinibrenneria salicis]KAA9002705.1 DUF1435 domain-containing protein [Affinibrenneria salicis]KAA9003008.1 DUF1435 domain-containing protein [Affinibrenneria salicis]
MFAAIIAACGRTERGWRLRKRLSSAWSGLLLPCAALPLLLLFEPSLTQLKGIILLAMLSTLFMLCRRRLRPYLLLPSCIALVCGLAAVVATLGAG